MSEERLVFDDSVHDGERLIKISTLKQKLNRRQEGVFDDEDLMVIADGVPINIYVMELNDNHFWIGWCKSANNKLVYNKKFKEYPNLHIISENYFVVDKLGGSPEEVKDLQIIINKIIYVLYMDIKLKNSNSLIRTSIASTGDRMRQFVEDYQCMTSNSDIDYIHKMLERMKTIYKDPEDLFRSSYTSRTKLTEGMKEIIKKSK